MISSYSYSKRPRDESKDADGSDVLPGDILLQAENDKIVLSLMRAL